MKPDQGHDISTGSRKKFNWVNGLILLTICFLGAITVVKVFGTTTEAKFAEANNSVSSEVRFDGPSDYDYTARNTRSSSRPQVVVQKKVIRESASSRDRSADAARLRAAEQAAAKARAKLDAVQQELATRPVTEEPIEQRENNVKARDYGVNPMTLTRQDPLSTFAIDVDTASYTRARSNLNSQALPYASEVRVEEFINYFDYEYPNPKEGAFGVNLEAAPSPFSTEKNRYLVRVGVQGKRVLDKDRKPTHLTFLVDVSGSMNAYNKLPMAKQALETLVDNLGASDTVSLVTYAGDTSVILASTSARNGRKIKQAIRSLSTRGGTDMGIGMQLAYEQASKSHEPGHNSRVVVISDGDANIGNTSHNAILQTIEGYIADGITMSTIGVGMGSYNDTMMEQLANKGNGNYYYIDSQTEANKLFSEKLTSTLEVIAKDVKIQVEFNPDAVSQYRLIGYENRDIADRDFRNDAVDAGEIGAGHSVTALYEIVRVDDATDLLATVRIRHKDPEDERPTEYSYPLTRGNVYSQLADASKSFQFATAVATFAELLRNSPYAKHVSYELVTEIARGSAGKWADRQEFVELVSKATALHKRGY